MPEPRKPKFLVVGGGLGGSLLATRLGRAGFEVDVYEMRGDMRVESIAAGRSINLALSHRGICALDEVGLANEALSQAIPMKGRMIHSTEGALNFQPYGTEPNQAIYSISRAALNMVLLDAATECPGVRLFFHERCTHLDLETGAVEFAHGDSSRKSVVEDRVVLGADGAFSAVRQRMQRLDRFNYRQDYLEHGYKELTIPPGSRGSHALEKNALHIWPRKSFMMIALPNLDGSFTCTLFFPLDGPVSFAALKTESDLQAFFEGTFPDAVPLMPDLAGEFFRNPTSTLVTIRCGPWFVRDRVALVGDAAHAVVPFYGQGMNAAFEDVLVLRETLERHPDEIEKAFAEYYRLRKPDADALAELALENFVEMRDKTGNRLFRVKKTMDHALHRLFPRGYVPLYTMITFTRMSYAAARRRATLQNRIVATVAVVLLMVLLGGLAAWVTL
jgi:kynurenine 3-monooxygenase